MQFMITAYDGKDEKALERRMNIRPHHLENMAKIKKTAGVLCAGGILNENGQPVGSFLIMDFENRAMLDKYLEQEPYVTGKVWQEINVEVCNVVIMNGEKVGK